MSHISPSTRLIELTLVTDVPARLCKHRIRPSRAWRRLLPENNQRDFVFLLKLQHFTQWTEFTVNDKEIFVGYTLACQVLNRLLQVIYTQFTWHTPLWSVFLRIKPLKFFARCTHCSFVSMVSQCRLVSGWDLRKWRSAPPYGPCGSVKTYLLRQFLNWVEMYSNAIPVTYFSLFSWYSTGHFSMDLSPRTDVEGHPRDGRSRLSLNSCHTGRC